ncbi:peptidyl-prolyl cis-trans isomerase FKBP14 isoform 5 [Mus musculus]|uniref:peptidyl-prolyl cis-trans isomerase FKBP14 isoform 5 n=1 Tax=Mus musculus TaxID=10090 RepID=UPI00216B6851|nr:peptidyl-prolyl cis-trans isomerase FKBP14 isoform 5 [Mus musculus]
MLACLLGKIPAFPPVYACPFPVSIGNGKIPPESTLIFNIDLLEIRNGPRSHESFQEMDLNDDWRLSKHELELQAHAPFAVLGV